VTVAGFASSVTDDSNSSIDVHTALDPESGVEHSYCAMCSRELTGRILNQWSDADLEAFCRWYNVGWVVARSPAAVERWAKYPAARPVARLTEAGAAVVLYELQRPRSYILSGKAKWESADPNRVTLTDVVLAFPIAYYMARIASPRVRRLLVVAILMPLWASYLVKVFAWRSIFLGNGLLSWVLAPFGIPGPGTDELTNSWIVFSYMWLPYMILPIYAGLERVPSSLLEASADLGARAGTTFRRVVLPIVFPAMVAGSIFTFSLTLGDYIIPDLVSDAKFIGNVIYDNSALGNFPVAAAYSMVPIVIMLVYLLVARRLGAFESL